MRLNKNCFQRFPASLIFFSSSVLAPVDSGEGLGELGINGFSSLEHTFPVDVVGDTLNEDVDKGGLGLT